VGWARAHPNIGHNPKSGGAQSKKIGASRQIVFVPYHFLYPAGAPDADNKPNKVR